MKKVKKISGILIMIIMILVFITLVWIISQRNYIGENFFKNISYIYRVEDLKAEKGEPVKDTIATISKDYQVRLIVYDDIVVAYRWSDGMSHGVAWTQISNDTYTFGGKKLAVGISREQVEKVLKNSKRPSPMVHWNYFYDSEGEIQRKTTEEYFDDFYENGLGFAYDENDCVEYIYILNGTM